MSLIARLEGELKEAMAARDADRRDTLRLILNALRSAEKDLQRPLSEDEELQVLQRERKRRLESIEAFEAAGRTELVEKERADRDVLEPYAPTQLDPGAVDALIDEAFAATGATGPQDVGKVMGFIMGKARGQVDGGLVQQKVKERLG